MDQQVQIKGKKESAAEETLGRPVLLGRVSRVRMVCNRMEIKPASNHTGSYRLWLTGTGNAISSTTG